MLQSLQESLPQEKAMWRRVKSEQYPALTSKTQTVKPPGPGRSAPQGPGCSEGSYPGREAGEAQATAPAHGGGWRRGGEGGSAGYTEGRPVITDLYKDSVSLRRHLKGLSPRIM